MIRLFSLYAVLVIGQVLGATLPHRRDGLPDAYKWPNYCDNVNLRDKTLLNTPNVFSFIDPVRLYVGDNYKNKNEQGEGLSIPVWMSRWYRPNYQWKCSSASCDIGSDFDFNKTCRTSPVSGMFGVTLEQFSVLYAYLDSLSGAIENARDHLVPKLPTMFDDFGGELKDGMEWDKVIGTITAGVSVLATVVSGPTGGIISSGFGLAGAMAGYLVPEQEKEKQFNWNKETSSAFVDNVRVIMVAIDTWIEQNMMQPIADIATYINLEGNLFFTVGDGKFAADPSPPPLVNETNSNILASLAAPVINRLMQQSNHGVIVFDNQAWKNEGYDLCGDPNLKFYEEIQTDGRYCDADGNLVLIMRFWPEPKGKWMYHDTARNIKGLDKWSDYGITRKQIIEGSLENFKAGGFNHGLSAEEATQRLRNMQGIEEIAWGKINVWNLPVCHTGPRNKHSEALDKLDAPLEEWMAASMLKNCGHYMKDANGVSWPYGDPWCDVYKGIRC